MEQNVLIDVQMEEYGILLHQHVYAQLANHGMDTSVLLVLMEEHGIWTLKVVNAQFHLLGMESLVFFAQVVESIIHPVIYVNVR